MFSGFITSTMKFCWIGAQVYWLGMGLTEEMILMGMDWILPSLSLASALLEGGGGRREEGGCT